MCNIYLQEQKRAEEKTKKRKAEEDQLVSLKAKRRRLEEDISSLEASADKKAVEAEKNKNFKLLMESNALRKKVAEKKEELNQLQ